jgi:GNAT superfamily N-acetyltransferase
MFPPMPTPTGKAVAAGAAIRRLDPTRDSYAALTALLHRAYAGQVAMGLRPLAGRQDEATTQRRCESGECFIALLPGAPGERLVGTILFQEVEEAALPPHFLQPHVAHFSLFAVDPEYQGYGIGGALLAAVESRARALGFTELALSMAEPDTALMRFYERRGFRFVEHWRWPYTNYRSAILTKVLPQA